MPPGRLAVFWGVMPHLPLRVVPGTEGFGLRLPLPWLLEWNLPQTLTRRLLRLEVLADDSPHDLGRMKDWVQLTASGDAPRREIVLLEVQARLWRLAMNGSVCSRYPGQRRRRDRGSCLQPRGYLQRGVQHLAARHTHAHGPARNLSRTARQLHQCGRRRSRLRRILFRVA